MEVFESRYFNLNRKLLTYIGLWPYAIKTKTIMRTLIMVLMIGASAPHLISAIINYKIVDRLILNILTLSVGLCMIVRLFGLIKQEHDMKKLYRSIADNWIIIIDENERKILFKYSNRGRLMTIFYSIAIMSSGIIVCLLPLLSKLLDKMCPLVEPRQRIKFLEGEFFVDSESHYMELLIYDCFSVMLAALVDIACDCMYIASAEQCCALYAIVRYRLRKLKRMVGKHSLAIEHDESSAWLIRIIQLHQRASNFTATLNDAYSTCFFLLMLSYIVIIPLNACAVLANLHNSIRLCPYVISFAAIGLNLYILFWPGQRISDHALSLSDEDLYCNEWYATSLRTKKLLLMFMLRCSEPTPFTAGGLFLMNFETYAMIARTSLSYVTVVASFR